MADLFRAFWFISLFMSLLGSFTGFLRHTIVYFCFNHCMVCFQYICVRSCFLVIGSFAMWGRLSYPWVCFFTKCAGFMVFAVQTPSVYLFSSTKSFQRT